MVIGVEAAGCVVAALSSVVLVEVGLGLEIGAKAEVEVEMFVEFEATRGAVALI